VTKLQTSTVTLLCAALTLCAVISQPATAATIGLDPAMQSVQTSDAVSVDVVFSDLGGEIVSAYDLDITYDPAVLAPVGVVFTTALGDDLLFEVLNASDLSAPGVVDMAQLSLLGDDALFALQGGDTVTVATLSFQAVGAGTTELGFVFDAVNDVKGRDAAILSLDATGASATVAAIPEPSGARCSSPSAACSSLRRCAEPFRTPERARSWFHFPGAFIAPGSRCRSAARPGPPATVRSRMPTPPRPGGGAMTEDYGFLRFSRVAADH